MASAASVPKKRPLVPRDDASGNNGRLRWTKTTTALSLGPATRRTSHATVMTKPNTRMKPARAHPSALNAILTIPMRPLRSLLLCATLLTLVSPMRATTVIPPDFSDLAASSDYVVRGKVKSLSNEIRQQDGREVPFTLVEIEVSEVIAGTPPAKVVLTALGGRTSDGGELVVEGVPHFVVGDDSIYFVKDNGTSFYPLYGVMHGLYPIKRDKATGRDYVARANGLPLSATAEVALPLAEGKEAQLLRRQLKISDALSVAEFKQSIRDARAAAKNGGKNHVK